jgi:uncharacterized membrane protein
MGCQGELIMIQRVRKNDMQRSRLIAEVLMSVGLVLAAMAVALLV